jgi:Zn-dependent protease with chaperone function
MPHTLAAPAGTPPHPAPNARIEVERWPSEMPLFALAAAASALLWLLALVSVVGILYGAMFGVFFFVMHVAFVAHVRGSGVRLGPDQFPELHARVQEIAQRMGMEKVPEAYLMQAGGALNAFATRFLGANLIVLFSDLLEACGDDTAARDLIIAHELGHIHAGHLRWHWFLLPANLVPFLGTALSRAREYTCDRYGLAGAGDREGALLGLAILAAGATHGRAVNRTALVRQRADLNTGWMTIGEWTSTHPPLARRLCALDPSLGDPQYSSAAGVARALLILALFVSPLLLGAWFGMGRLPAWLAEVEEQAEAARVQGDAQGRAYELPAGFVTPGDGE